MYKITRTKQFKRDYKRIIKQNKNINELDNVIITLSQGKLLDKKYFDHKLIGNYRGRRECHIEPDWLLIYKLEKDEIIFERTGSHSELFK